MVWLNRILLALLVAGAIAYFPRELAETGNSEDLARVRAERDELTASNAILRSDIELLSAEVSALHGSLGDGRPQAPHNSEVERIAREDLNLIRPGEVVFEVHQPAEEKSGGGGRP